MPDRRPDMRVPSRDGCPFGRQSHTISMLDMVVLGLPGCHPWGIDIRHTVGPRRPLWTDGRTLIMVLGTRTGQVVHMRGEITDIA